MPRWAGLAWVFCGLILVGGCRLCADCDDEAYPSYGGAWQRTHRDSGRVGSIFDPGGTRASDLSQRAQSDGPDATNREGMGAGESSERSDQDSAVPNQDGERDIMDTDGEEPPEQERKDQLEELERRYRNLQLEEINHQRPRPQEGAWQ